MIIIPAIDLKEGKCVRLRQGHMNSSTVFNDNPGDQVKTWVDKGAPRIHVVDLDGSVEGKPINGPAIESIVRAAGVPVQLGGGVRNRAIIQLYLDMGVDVLIMGTIAVRAPDEVKAHMEEFPGRIAVAVDARDGAVAVSGWTEGSTLSAKELAGKFEDAKPAAFIYTDIEKDGMMKGPNIEATREFAESTEVDVILSGGVTSLSDVKNALALSGVGVTGIIIGRALYEGSIDLEEAIGLVEAR
jgi:phosphoribosylformimino-5-aminoimidazole carboxamide ribotide isomerase